MLLLVPAHAQCLLMLFSSQAGVITKEVMLCEPPGATTLTEGGRISPTTADPAGTRAARYSPLGDAFSLMPPGRASQAASTCHLPQGVPPLQEAQETVSTPQGVCRTDLSSFGRDYQVRLHYWALYSFAVVDKNLAEDHIAAGVQACTCPTRQIPIFLDS